WGPCVLWRRGRQFLCNRRGDRPEAVGPEDRRRDRRRGGHFHSERDSKSRGGDRVRISRRSFRGQEGEDRNPRHLGRKRRQMTNGEGHGGGSLLRSRSSARGGLHRAEVAPLTRSALADPIRPDMAGPPAMTSYQTKSRKDTRTQFEQIVLLLQGGGALGSYQAGVYQALAEADLHPNWIAGISIGAINSAIIAGNAPDKRVDRLREFWETVSTSPLGLPYFKSVELQNAFVHHL